MVKNLVENNCDCGMLKKERKAEGFEINKKRKMR
jgi:hypothetical protein